MYDYSTVIPYGKIFSKAALCKFQQNFRLTTCGHFFHLSIQTSQVSSIDLLYFITIQGEPYNDYSNYTTAFSSEPTVQSTYNFTHTWHFLHGPRMIVMLAMQDCSMGHASF